MYKVLGIPQRTATNANANAMQAQLHANEKLKSSRARSIENIRKHHRIKLHALNTPAEPTSINQHEREKEVIKSTNNPPN
jgi:hypothetical protein